MKDSCGHFERYLCDTCKKRVLDNKNSKMSAVPAVPAVPVYDAVDRTNRMTIEDLNEHLRVKGETEIYCTGSSIHLPNGKRAMHRVTLKCTTLESDKETAQYINDEDWSAQLMNMDVNNASHPYYYGGYSCVGGGGLYLVKEEWFLASEAEGRGVYKVL